MNDAEFYEPVDRLMSKERRTQERAKRRAWYEKGYAAGQVEAAERLDAALKRAEDAERRLEDAVDAAFRNGQLSTLPD